MVEVGEPTAVVGQFLKAELTNAKRKNGESFRQSVCVGVRACVCVCVCGKQAPYCTWNCVKHVQIFFLRVDSAQV